MIIVLNDLTDNTYYVINQENKTHRGWSSSLDEALNSMEDTTIDKRYYTMSIDEYIEAFPDCTITSLSQQEDTYEYW